MFQTHLNSPNCILTVAEFMQKADGSLEDKISFLLREGLTSFEILLAQYLLEQLHKNPFQDFN